MSSPSDREPRSGGSRQSAPPMSSQMSRLYGQRQALRTYQTSNMPTLKRKPDLDDQQPARSSSGHVLPRKRTSRLSEPAEKRIRQMIDLDPEESASFSSSKPGPRPVTASSSAGVRCSVAASNSTSSRSVSTASSSRPSPRPVTASSSAGVRSSVAASKSTSSRAISRGSTASSSSKHGPRPVTASSSAGVCSSVAASNSTSSCAVSRGSTSSTSTVDLEAMDATLDEFACLPPDEPMFCFPSAGTDKISIYPADAKRLREGEYLNDSVIDFYLKWLAHQLSVEHPDHADRTHIFSSFFYRRLTQQSGGEPYEGVRKWTAKVNIFEKRHLVVPINENWHWYLCLVCNVDQCIRSDRDESDRKPTIYLLDSLGIRRRKCAQVLTAYLRSAAKDRLGIDDRDFVEPQYVVAKVPMQTNNVDCGVYLLHFVEKFFSDQASFEEILGEQKSRRGMWDEQLVREKRAALVSLFARVYHDYRAAGKP